MGSVVWISVLLPIIIVKVDALVVDQILLLLMPSIIVVSLLSLRIIFFTIKVDCPIIRQVLDVVGWRVVLSLVAEMLIEHLLCLHSSSHFIMKVLLLFTKSE